MKKITAALLILTLLAGCAAPVAESPAPTTEPTPIPTEAVSPAPTPAATQVPTETPAPAGTFFDALPVTEEAVRAFYTGGRTTPGYPITVVEVTPYEGDFLVEYTDYDIEGKESWSSILDWVFGESGRVVRLTEMETFSSYEIKGQGQVFYTTGKYDGASWASLPRRYNVAVPGGAWENLATDMSSGLYCYQTNYGSWIDPAQSLRIAMFSGRYEQLCDARIDAEGLSFSFIPSTESMEAFMSFFPACTSTPGFETSVDEASGIFTLRLYNTSLKSGALTGEMAEWIGGYQNYEDLYPRTIPEGSLGADNLFLTGVEIHQDGSDAVISAKLTDRAGWFTVDCGNLGYDNIPYLRLCFREKNSTEVEYG